MNKKTVIEISALIIFVLLIGLGSGYFWGSEKKIEIKPAENQQAAVQEQAKVKTPVQEFKTETLGAQPEISYSPGQKVNLKTPEKLPESAKFKTFSYDKNIGKIISISGRCSDTYYTTLVFAAPDDYKKNPAAAKINRASECPANGNFETQFDLKDYNLSSGEYYFFVADQGKIGTWYNPR